MVKTISCVYTNEEQFNSFVIEHELFDYPNLLVQVFTGIVNRETIMDVQHTIKRYLSNAIIIGCTTPAEICEGTIQKNGIVLSFTIFDKTELDSVLLHQDTYENSFEMGRSLALQLISYHTKAIILFLSNLDINTYQFLEGIYKESQGIVISGGIAGNEPLFSDGIVFAGSEMTSNGVVAVALNSDVLQVQTYSNTEWQEIGKTHTVTKANGTTIFSIDERKPITILKQYLGEDFTNGLPKTGAELPFIVSNQEEKLSVFVTSVLKNGSIEVNRPVKEGEQLTFAYLNIKKTIEFSLRELKKLAKSSIESIFVYNSLARKEMIGPYSEAELEMLNSIADTAGFFTYGGIYQRKNLQPLIVGHSHTYLTLSESDASKQHSSKKFGYDLPEYMKGISALTHLMEATQKDALALDDHLKVSEQYYRSLFENNVDFVYSTNLQGHFTSVNPAFMETFGYKEEELIGKPALKFVKEEDIPRVRMHFYRALKGKEQYYNIELPHKSGESNYFQIRMIPITVNNETVGIYGIGRNITEQKAIEEKMTRLAFYDRDTGLPNRIKFTEKLMEMIEQAKKKKRLLSVVSIDLDRFKMINDSFGHFAGDVILREIAIRIQKALPPGSFLGRFSGDKFTLVLSKNISLDKVKIITRSILDTIAKPVYFDNQEFFISASIGASIFPNDGLDASTLLRNADVATNRSKSYGGNRVTFFSSGMNEEAKIRLELESYLRKALQKEEFYLCYQPLINLKTGKLYGSEALIRWNHPKLGLVSPGEFIPLAEETGLIEDIGSWVLTTACKQNKKWQLMGMKELSISVNVSAQQFQQPGFINVVMKALTESELEPQYLNLELTESTMIRNIEYNISVMQALQELGVKVSIDDFGTGYSSLSYLRNLPIDTLKIDRSFINNLRIDTSDIAIVKAIITMGYGLSVKVVAEGVETQEQIELLKELNCHYAQGFYFNKPLVIEQFEEEFLKSC